ncbi:type 1 fimbrial protein [Phytobacter diazotrophicus]|uniref:fimbrial protein n=1 Tax=Phytobacter diazotrophicus TaxID=395631 RepID=UPI0014523E93|nr:fimbrial protein [Phytobacter diazotrophicus]QJF15653.1 type 1 fimbrial protein [Phytobacter diazotrophicus]
MNERKRWFLIVPALLCGLMSKVAIGFDFVPKQATATAYMNASVFPATLGNITSAASASATVLADGWPNSSYLDSVKIKFVTINPDLTARGFTLQVKVGNSSWMSDTAAVGKCVWVDANCSTNGSTSTEAKNKPTVPVSVRLLRNSTAAYDPIPAGTDIATITLWHYSSFYPSGRTFNAATLYFKFDGAVTPIIPTCDITNFDNNVTLPDVRRADLVNHGTGRYTGVTKEFNINLACENTPRVTVRFNGDKMSGVASEDVLMNKLSGNDNIGIQLFYKSNAMKIGENIELVSAAADSENLKFNAYYYYKGGAVQSGPIKSQTEFTFTYE